MQLAGSFFVNVRRDQGFSGPFRRPGRPTYSAEIVCDVSGKRTFHHPPDAAMLRTEGDAMAAGLRWLEAWLRSDGSLPDYR